MTDLDKSQSFVGAPWWRGAVVYQVYVRSFADSNGDGVGDFPGLISKLDYIAALGADAIWLSPIHPSPNRDWGYDVSDYSTVNPDYGTEADFDRLLVEAHARRLKILTDEVLAHTSDEHAWFKASLESEDKRDWYVWAPPRDDGTAPNNWLSAFGGPAWSYHPARRQCYHHKFLRQQPKLNWHSRAAREATLTVLDRWLARGVDGFRLDVANAFLHDASLADNQPVPTEARTSRNWSHVANLQIHSHDSNLEANLAVLDEIRRRVERHPDRFVMGEFSEHPERAGAYLAPDEGLHSGYTFQFLEAHEVEPSFIVRHYEELARHKDHWPSIAFCNHDVMRTATRFGGKNAPPDIARLMLAILISLRGTILLYQGEELGLPEADLNRNQLRDPVGDLYYPLYRGRDGCRTPMPWDASAASLGFTMGSPWLPISPAHRALAVSVQEHNVESTLAFARRALSIRKNSAALRLGDIEFLDAPARVLALLRTYGNERVLCVFNMNSGETEFHHPLLEDSEPLLISHETRSRNVLPLSPYMPWIGSVRE